jgi:hypothetical protein
LTGGTAAQLQGGRHLRFSPETPIANLHLTLLETLGISMDRFGNSTGRLSL